MDGSVRNCWPGGGRECEWVKSLFDLSGRVAVVTGGTTGLGREIALGLARAGADVVPSSRRQELVEAAAAEIEALGRRSLRVDCATCWIGLRSSGCTMR